MPEAQRLYTQWRNANERAKYPFSSRATLTNGNVTIPEEVFLDARLYPTGGAAGQYLSSIEKNADTITLTISDQVSGELASAEVAIADIVAEDIKLLELHDSFSRIAGVLVTEPARLGLLTSLPIGTHAFTIDQTEFTATAVTPLLNTGLRSIVGGGIAHYGEVWLVGGLGVVLEHEYDMVHGEDQVVVNIVGEPLSKRVVCEDEGGVGNPRFVSRVAVSSVDVGAGLCDIDVEGAAGEDYWKQYTITGASFWLDTYFTALVGASRLTVYADAVLKLDTGFITTPIDPEFDHTFITGADTLTIYVEASHAPVSAWGLQIGCASSTAGIEIAPDEFGDLKVCVCGIDVDDTVLRVQPEVDGITFGVIGGRVSG